jgi:osmoprotectant transport system substrate-binding protein
VDRKDLPHQRNKNTTEDFMKKLVGYVMALILGLGLLSGCTPKAEGEELTIIDGDYGEMYLFTQMAKILIEEKTDYKVKINPTMAVTLAYDQIRYR